jgi:hypothetical protein
MEYEKCEQINTSSVSTEMGLRTGTRFVYVVYGCCEQIITSSVPMEYGKCEQITTSSVSMEYGSCEQ